ncbi:MAG TPA: hypothetical protein VF764_04405, partial [Steroidobacteraceae bacterium]
MNTTFLNVTPLTTPAGHIPIGTGAAAVDCNGSGCHSANGGAAGGFKIGTANLNPSTLGATGHATVATAVTACSTCHENGTSYLGMIASSSSAWGDTRPTAYDSYHPTTGDCTQCHTTTPTFATNMTSGSKPANHIPTTAPCAQCHTTLNNYASYSSPGVHQGVTGCNACHGPGTGPFAGPPPSNTITIIGLAANHITTGPTGSQLDCNASGCHMTANVTPGGNGFLIGAANINSPTLNVAGHASVQGVVALCATCHQAATSLGMVASTNTAAGDSRPNATLDLAHTQGQLATADCGNCHVTSPVFASNTLPNVPKPSNHIPTTAVCAQCHTTVGNFGVYSVTGVHQGITTCAQCHGPGTGPFAGPPPGNTITIVGLAANHIPIGTTDCGSSGCHTTSNVNPGGFVIGAGSAGSPSNPTLTVAGHASVASGGVGGCQGCHETAPYTGMTASSASAWGDSRPTAYDKNHPTAGDCNSCHTTTPTFNTDQTGNAKPTNHIPTTVPPYSSAPACATCHTTAGNNAVYSVAAVHT